MVIPPPKYKPRNLVKTLLKNKDKKEQAPTRKTSCSNKRQTAVSSNLEAHPVATTCTPVKKSRPECEEFGDIQHSVRSYKKPSAVQLNVVARLERDRMLINKSLTNINTSIYNDIEEILEIIESSELLIDDEIQLKVTMVKQQCQLLNQDENATPGDSDAILNDSRKEAHMGAMSSHLCSILEQTRISFAEQLECTIRDQSEIFMKSKNYEVSVRKAIDKEARKSKEAEETLAKRRIEKKMLLQRNEQFRAEYDDVRREIEALNYILSHEETDTNPSLFRSIVDSIYTTMDLCNETQLEIRNTLEQVQGLRHEIFQLQSTDEPVGTTPRARTPRMAKKDLIDGRRLIVWSLKMNPSASISIQMPPPPASVSLNTPMQKKSVDTFETQNLMSRPSNISDCASIKITSNNQDIIMRGNQSDAPYNLLATDYEDILQTILDSEYIPRETKPTMEVVCDQDLQSEIVMDIIAFVSQPTSNLIPLVVCVGSGYSFILESVFGSKVFGKPRMGKYIRPWNTEKGTVPRRVSLSAVAPNDLACEEVSAKPIIGVLEQICRLLDGRYESVIVGFPRSNIPKETNEQAEEEEEVDKFVIDMKRIEALVNNGTVQGLCGLDVELPSQISDTVQTPKCEIRSPVTDSSYIYIYTPPIPVCGVEDVLYAIDQVIISNKLFGAHGDPPNVYIPTVNTKHQIGEFKSFGIKQPGEEGIDADMTIFWMWKTGIIAGTIISLTDDVRFTNIEQYKTHVAVHNHNTEGLTPKPQIYMYLDDHYILEQ